MMEEIGNDKLVLYAIPMFLGLVALEAALSHVRKHGWYLREDALASLGMGVGNVIIAVSLKGGWILLYWAAYQYRWFDLNPHSAWVWVVGIVLQDFCFYWYHRCSHRVRLLWVAHEAHHSSRYCNLTTALRQSWLSPFYSYLYFLPLAILGFHPLLILTFGSISLIYQFFLHTESVDKLGPLEWVMNTPSHHRVHHGTNPQYIDTNYAGIFIVWDRLFGTFEQEREKVRYGVTSELPAHNPFAIATHQAKLIWRDLTAAKSLRHKLGILCMGPEWWSTQRSQELADSSKEPKPAAL